MTETPTKTRLKPVREHPNPKDAQQVEVMSGLGDTPEHIASHLQITPAELQRFYPTQLQNGPLEANLRVAQTFHEMATSGEFPAVTIKWMELRAGWTTASTPLDSTADEELAREKLRKLLNRGK